MKYVNVVLICTLLIFSVRSDSQILGIDLDPRNIDPCGIFQCAEDLRKALTAVGELRDAKSKIQAELDEANNVLNYVTPVLKKQTRLVVTQGEVIAAKTAALNKLQEELARLKAENSTLKSKIADIEVASDTRVLKFLSMYQLDVNSQEGQSFRDQFLGKKVL